MENTNLNKLTLKQLWELQEKADTEGNDKLAYEIDDYIYEMGKAE